jgi:hypothetical protein
MPTVIGLDIAKQIFQLHSVDPETGEMQRAELVEHLGKLSPAIADRPVSSGPDLMSVYAAI